jgi:phosphoribosylformylglycinamidine synthase
MALTGGVGAELDAAPEGAPAHAFWFGEDQGRYVVAAASNDAGRIQDEADKAGLPVSIIGRVGGDALKLRGEAPLMLDVLQKAHERWLPDFMGG